MLPEISVPTSLSRENCQEGYAFGEDRETDMVPQRITRRRKAIAGNERERVGDKKLGQQQHGLAQRSLAGG
jgi:hypothetical protein